MKPRRTKKTSNVLLPWERRRGIAAGLFTLRRWRALASWCYAAFVFCLVLAVIFVYSMGNIGVVVHYWLHRRRQGPGKVVHAV